MDINTLQDSLQDFKTLPPLRNANIDHKQNLSLLNKSALWITNHVGSMGFFLIIFCWTVLWLGWNIFGPQHFRFDPYPGFILWLFISNVMQIFLMPLIMIGQNLQSQHAELRAEVDFEINTKAELEIQRVLIHLEKQNALILEIIERIGNDKISIKGN
jgi:uncharacterized membrane protein